MTLAITGHADQADRSAMALTATPTGAVGSVTYAWTVVGPGTSSNLASSVLSSSTAASTTFTPSSDGVWRLTCAATDSIGTIEETVSVRVGWRGTRILDMAEISSSNVGLYTGMSAPTTTNGVTTFIVPNVAQATTPAHLARYYFATGLLSGSDIDSLAMLLDTLTGSTSLICLGIGWGTGLDPAAGGYRGELLTLRAGVGGVATTWNHALTANNGTFSWSSNMINGAALATLLATWNPARFGQTYASLVTAYNNNTAILANVDNTARVGSLGTETIYWYLAAGDTDAAHPGGTVSARASVAVSRRT